MAYDTQLANRVRTYLSTEAHYEVEEKTMFGGLAFIVNGKMCVNISGARLMCRFDPLLMQDVATRKGYLPVIMKNKPLNGYCYVAAEGYKGKKDFEFWMALCLDFNKQAAASKKKTTRHK